MLVIAVTMALERFRRWLVPFVAVSLASALSWLWLVYEASNGRRTLIFDFEETGNPFYQAWSLLLPDHHRWPGGTWALSILWGLALMALVWRGWRSAGPSTTVRGEPAMSTRPALAVPDLQHQRAIG